MPHDRKHGLRRAREGEKRRTGSPAIDRVGVGGGAVEKGGWTGWDEYAPFYDWENARTLGRRDVAFWRRLARAAGGPILELGCGTGRVSLPLARAGLKVVGLDRSAAMLSRFHERLQRSSSSGLSPVSMPQLVRGDIRALPFRAGRFRMAIAPYGVLQSLLAERDLVDALDSVAGVLEPRGLFGLDLVPDVPRWREYSNRVQLRGRSRGGVHLTLIESVRQDRARQLTTFQERFVERRRGGSTEHRFELTFRTLSVEGVSDHLDRAGFAVDCVLGDYRGSSWDERADVWIILAKKR